MALRVSPDAELDSALGGVVKEHRILADVRVAVEPVAAALLDLGTDRCLITKVAGQVHREEPQPVLHHRTALASLALEGRPEGLAEGQRHRQIIPRRGEGAVTSRVGTEHRARCVTRRAGT